jgi:hypothetical protein
MTKFKGFESLSLTWYVHLTVNSSVLLTEPLNIIFWRYLVECTEPKNFENIMFHRMADVTSSKDYNDYTLVAWC